MSETTGNEKNDTNVDPADDETCPDEPTPEEQMAKFEDALKEEDWGHQPC